MPIRADAKRRRQLLQAQRTSKAGNACAHGPRARDPRMLQESEHAANAGRALAAVVLG